MGSVSHSQKSGKFLDVWVVLSWAQNFYRHTLQQDEHRNAFFAEITKFSVRTDFCAPITIGIISSTYRIAIIRTGAFYFTYTYTINE